MSKKKILATLLGIFIVTLTAIFLIQTFYPNWVTKSAITLLTVTGPKYLQSKLEWVALTIGGVTATVGAAKKTINDTKAKANIQVSDAQQQTQSATGNVNALFTENQTLTTQNTKLQSDLSTAQSSSSEAVSKMAALQNQNQVQATQLAWYKDILKVNGVQPDPNDVRVIEAKTPVVA